MFYSLCIHLNTKNIMKSTATLKLIGPVTFTRREEGLVSVAGIAIRLNHKAKNYQNGDILIIKARLDEAGVWHGSVKEHLAGGQAPSTPVAQRTAPPPTPSAAPILIVPAPIAQATPAQEGPARSAGGAAASTTNVSPLSRSARFGGGAGPASTPVATGQGHAPAAPPQRPVFAHGPMDEDVPF